MQKVFRIVTIRLGNNKGVSHMSMEADKTNISMWTLFMASSMQAALHGDPSFTENLEVFKNPDFENIESSEILNVTSLETSSLSWERFTLLNDQAMKWAKARVYVYSDSVFGLGGLNAHDDAIRRWKDQVSTLQMCNTFRELQGLDGEPIEFEWTIFTGSSALQLLHTIQKDLEGKRIDAEEFSDRIMFMSMFNDIDLEKRGNEDTCALTPKNGQWLRFKF